MHLFDAQRRFYGGNAIVAGGLPTAAGLAFADAQLNHRGHFVRLPHPVFGSCTFDGLATRFSGLETGPFTASPTLGQHTDAVLRDTLGMADAEIARLRERGVLA